MRFKSLSPLRYPGGKSRLSDYLARLVAAQAPRPRQYAEPFAGGAGAALRLLVNEEVRTAHINDLSPGIAAFWRAMFTQTDAFTKLLLGHPITMDAWHEAKAIYMNPEGHDDLELGFATFFLNRCNRSGILNAGPIGGLNQTGNWKIDARFNRDDLADKIRYLGAFRNRVRLTELDARVFLDDMQTYGHDVLVYVDPPYLVQGEHLYLDSLSLKDHRELADQLRRTDLRWFMTYDADERITADLYEGLRCAAFDISHTAQTQHVGAEYAVYSDGLSVPDLQIIKGGQARWIA
ncbi:MAG: DNA adenine methylase [Rhodoglobus sp.]